MKCELDAAALMKADVNDLNLAIRNSQSTNKWTHNVAQFDALSIDQFKWTIERLTPKTEAC